LFHWHGSVGFDDEQFGGWTVSDFDLLVCECRFLDLLEQPGLLTREGALDCGQSAHELEGGSVI
jgi:hypothetical protein